MSKYTVMCLGSAEWWLDHIKGTKNSESPGMQQYKVTAHCEMQSMSPLGGLGACPPRKILNFSSSEIAFWAILG